MKKIIAVLLTVLTLFSLTACKNNNKKKIVKLSVSDSQTEENKEIYKDDKTEISFISVKGIEENIFINKYEAVSVCLNIKNNMQQPLKFRVKSARINGADTSVLNFDTPLTNAISPGGSLNCEFSISKQEMKEKNNIIEFIVAGDTLKGEEIITSDIIKLDIKK